MDCTALLSQYTHVCIVYKTGIDWVVPQSIRQYHYGFPLTGEDSVCTSSCFTEYRSLLAIRAILTLTFSSYTLCMLLPHAYYFLFTFLFPSTDFFFFHAQPYCLCIASCTVLHSPAQSCTVCLLMHSLLRRSLVIQYIRTG